MIITALCGVGVGVLSGLLGIGGGIVVIPLMRLAFGASGLVASGTSLFVILPTSLSGFIGRMRGDGVIVWLGLSVGLGGVAFSPLGSWVGEMVGGLWPMVAAAIIIVYTGVKMAVRAIRAKRAAKPGTAPAHAQMAASSDSADSPISTGTTLAPAPTDTQSPFPRTRKHILQAVAVGIVAGFLSGFIGVGGGFLIVPMCMSFFKLSFKEASGVSLLALCIIAVPGIITHALFGHVDFLRGILIAAGSIPGAFLGSALLKRVSDRALRIAFGFLLLGVGAMLALNEFAL